MEGGNFLGVKTPGVNFLGGEISWVWTYWVWKFSVWTFWGAKFRGCELTGCVLSGVNLRSANLLLVNFRGTADCHPPPSLIPVDNLPLWAAFNFDRTARGANSVSPVTWLRAHCWHDHSWFEFVEKQLIQFYSFLSQVFVIISCVSFWLFAIDCVRPTSPRHIFGESF